MRMRYMTVIMVVLFGAALSAQGQIDTGDSGGKGTGGNTGRAARAVKAESDVDRSDFCISVGVHYRVSDKEIGLARKKKIKDDELPVLFHLSARARVKPEVVMDLRARGLSWSQITLHLGLGADIYYVPLKADPGPPYGNAYGHFKKRKRSEWHGIVLADVDIVNLVHLRFMSEYHGFSPDEVVRIRAKHGNCFTFHADLKKKKRERHEEAERKRASGKDGSGRSGKSSGEDGGKHGDRSKDAERKQNDDHGRQKGSKGKSGKKGKG